MAIITSQANAARANQERLQAIAEGERNVATAEYEQEVIKAEQVVIAEREREVAVIAANRQVEVNREQLEAARIDVQTADEEREAQQLRADGEAYAKRVVLEADGALAQKLETYTNINESWAAAYANRQVPQFMTIGGTGTEGGDVNQTSGTYGDSGADIWLQVMGMKAQHDLTLDMSIPCLLYTSPSPRDRQKSRMPSSA